MENIFKRSLYQEMLDWKRNLANHYALLVEGARRVGKTHLVTTFVQNEYESFIYIDFSIKDKQVRECKRAFDEETRTEDLLERLSLIFGVRLIPGKSCIVFDEVQMFPTARGAIKQLVAYGKYHYIETGSLVGIKENVKDIVIPSEEHAVKLHPLSFDEFLAAIGETVLADGLRKAYANGMKVPDYLHDKAMRAYRLYMVVGGMPQAIAAYLSGGDHKLTNVEVAKREIIALYEKDIGKYAHGYASKVRSIFRTMPAALNTREKKFHLSDIDGNARMRRYENAFLWLADAGIANVAYNATTPDVGLKMSVESSLFKCYGFDTGMLLTQAMSGTQKNDDRLLRGILYDNLGINEGMFFENAVAAELAYRGFELLFHSVKDRKHPEKTMEIDFVVRSGIKVCPIEVKSSRCLEHASLDRFVKAYSRKIGRRLVITSAPPFEKDGIAYVPIYLCHLLFKDL